MSNPTLHDQIVALLEQTLSTAENGEIHLPLITNLGFQSGCGYDRFREKETLNLPLTICLVRSQQLHLRPRLGRQSLPGAQRHPLLRASCPRERSRIHDHQLGLPRLPAMAYR